MRWGAWWETGRELVWSVESSPRKICWIRRHRCLSSAVSFVAACLGGLGNPWLGRVIVLYLTILLGNLDGSFLWILYKLLLFILGGGIIDTSFFIEKKKKKLVTAIKQFLPRQLTTSSIDYLYSSTWEKSVEHFPMCWNLASQHILETVLLIRNTSVEACLYLKISWFPWPWLKTGALLIL